MDFLWIIVLVVGIIFFAEKTGYRLINFGASGLLIYLIFQVDGDAFLIGLLLFFALAIMGYSVFGESD